MTTPTRRRWARERQRTVAMASAVLMILVTGCGLLPPPTLDAGEAREHYAGLPEALREVLQQEFGEIPPGNPDAIPYSGSVESCSWYPGGIAVPDDSEPSLLEDVAEVLQPVLTENGFAELENAEHDGVEPYLITTDDHGAEITVSRRGDVRVGIEIPVDTGGLDCDAAALT